MTHGESSAVLHESLAGARVLVTREEEGAGGLAAEIERQGGRPVRVPLLRTAPPEDAQALARAARQAHQYDWVVFTSARAVEAFFAASGPLEATVRLAAVGDATAERVRATFGQVALVPPQQTGEALARALGEHALLEGSRLLLPRADRARPELPRRLRSQGAEVVEVVAYRTLRTIIDAAALRARLESGEFGAVTFTSGSAVEAFHAAVRDRVFSGAPSRPVVASIGPATSRTLRELGLPVDAEAACPGLGELALAVARALGERANLVGGSEP